jgi:hypothetical protein
MPVAPTCTWGAVKPETRIKISRIGTSLILARPTSRRNDQLRVLKNCSLFKRPLVIGLRSNIAATRVIHSASKRRRNCLKTSDVRQDLREYLWLCSGAFDSPYRQHSALQGNSKSVTFANLSKRPISSMN